MTPREESTRTALHEMADGLLVTEDDLNRIEEDIMTLLESEPTTTTRVTRRRTGWAVAAAAVVVLGVAGTLVWRAGQDSAAPARVPAASPSASASPAVLVDPALVGLWREGQDGNWLWTFTADGRFETTRSAQDYVHGARQLEPFTAHNGTTYDVVIPPSSCLLRINATTSGPDTAVIKVVRNECPDLGAPGTEIRLDRLSKRTTSASSIMPGLPASSSSQARSMTVVSGSWLEPRSGTLLVMDAPATGSDAATYVIDDDGDGMSAPDQRGTVTMTSSGATVPVPDPSTPSGCAPVFSKVVTNTATMTTTAGAGGCFPEGSKQTWVALN